MFIRSRVATVAAVSLMAIPFAGCGTATGSSSVGSQAGARTQTTTPPATSAATGGSTSAGNVEVTASGDNIGAAAYLKSITPIRLQLARVHVSTAAMAAAIKAGDAPTAGRNAMAAAAGVRRALGIARRIRPRRQPWATIHTQLMANLQIGVVYLTRMGRDLNAVDIAAIDRWNTTVVPKIRASERWYREWAGNVAGFAAVDNVKAPGWLKTMDRWN